MNGIFKKFKKQPLTVTAPLDGAVVSMEKIPDEAFSSGVLGVCLGISPSDGKVYAPADGRIESVFSTKHAINLVLDGGGEVLIHMGLETVNLKGKHFSVLKQAGDRIKQGELLAQMDLAGIEQDGYSTLTPVVLCNNRDFSTVTLTEKKLVVHGDMLMELEK